MIPSLKILALVNLLIRQTIMYQTLSQHTSHMGLFTFGVYDHFGLPTLNANMVLSSN